ncbi:hypothetical protein PVAP13_1KG453405 [Panicum virgatum]|uniref:Uncharacterized protein n=1 Tax=Panicum virgatum TaxID=38727 RepID=A0A8T0XZE9_PANVG|nr:hypothetical protein PVAP13_1KG453405 [Panicum virgatum]
MPDQTGAKNKIIKKKRRHWSLEKLFARKSLPASCFNRRASKRREACSSCPNGAHQIPISSQLEHVLVNKLCLHPALGPTHASAR